MKYLSTWCTQFTAGDDPGYACGWCGVGGRLFWNVFTSTIRFIASVGHTICNWLRTRVLSAVGSSTVRSEALILTLTLLGLHWRRHRWPTHTRWKLLITCGDILSTLYGCRAGTGHPGLQC